MCLQCTVDAKMHGKKHVLPGFYLCRSMKDDYEWGKDKLGLVEVNDPTFILSVEPVKDPFYGMTDEQVDKNFKKFLKEHNAHMKAGRKIERDLMKGRSTRDVYNLITAATKLKKKPYDPNEDGIFGYWLSDYLARWIEKNALV